MAMEMKNKAESNGISLKHDGMLTIAVGRNRKELNWKNKEMLWSEMVAKLSRTIRTHETYESIRNFQSQSRMK